MNLRELRQRRGLTQTALARKAGLSQEAIAAYETGVRKPKISGAARIARELGCSTWDIFGLPGRHMPETVRALLVELERATPARRRALLVEIERILSE